MALIIKDRVKETTTTTGTGTITLAGASTGFRSFADIGNTNTTYYTIAGGNDWEVGLGTYTASGTTLSRDTVLSNSLGTTAKINFSAGTKDVFCTYPSEVAVTNANPTDITVNGLTVGRGDGNIATNTAYGFDAIGSPFISASNTNNVGIGYNALNTITSGVATITVTNGGSGFLRDDGGGEFSTTFIFEATCTFVSGTAASVYPNCTVFVNGEVISDVIPTTNGAGFIVGESTVMTVQPVGAEYSWATLPVLNVGTYKSASNNTAIGYNAGNTNLIGSNSVYIGSGAVGTGTNQIVIGAGANAGTQDNSVQIGNPSITQTNIIGLRATGAINIIGSSNETNPFNFGTLQRTNEIIIGGNALAGATTGAITLGRSTGSQTVNIANGASASGRTKTVNIGANGVSGSTTVINIGTAYTTSNPTIITLYGLIKQQVYTVNNLPTGTLGSRSFVTNALAPSFGAAVVGGGSVGVPVYHDGTSWKVG